MRLQPMLLAATCAASAAISTLCPAQASQGDATSRIALRATASPQAALRALEREYWQWRLTEYPEQATWLGDNRYNNRLVDLSPEAIDRRKAAARRTLARARAINASRLTGQDVISLSLLKYELGIAVEGQRFPSDLLALDQLDGPHIGFPQLAAATPFRDARDYEAYVARLTSYSRFLSQTTALLRRGMVAGWVQPNGPLRGVPAQIEGQLTDDPAKSVLYAPFDKVPVTLAAAERERLQAAGRRAIADSVLPALRQFRDFVRDEYMPAGTRATGISSLPQGREYYALAIRRETTTDLRPIPSMRSA